MEVNADVTVNVKILDDRFQVLSGEFFSLMNLKASVDNNKILSIKYIKGQKHTVYRKNLQNPYPYPCPEQHGSC